MADLFERVVDAVGDREAVVSGDVARTYEQLDERSNRLAHWLTAAGVERDHRVGVALYNRAEHLEALFAVFKLGAVPVNLNYRYTADELRVVLLDAQPTVVLHEPELAGPLRDAAVASIGLEIGGASQAALRSQPSTRPAIHRSGDARYMLYTGGTTGTPKGVVWRHEDLVFGALGGLNPGGHHPLTDPLEVAEVARRSRTRLLPACPLIHGTAQWTSLMTLLCGGTVILDPSIGFSAVRTWDQVERTAATQLVIVGDAFARPLLDALEAEPDRWDLSSLLVLMSGGAALTPANWSGLLEHLPGTVVVNGYGTSESGGHGRAMSFAGQQRTTGHGLISFVPDSSTTVLDDQLRPMAPGTGRLGRIGRRGPIPLGYHEDAQRSASVFPVVDGVRWSVPGDLATLEADGRIVLHGRDSSTINSGGEKVFAEEVERVLRSHPDVRDAVVLGVPDERWGERVTAIVAVRDPAAPIPVQADALTSWCRASLAGFKVPRRLVFRDHIERRPSGKPDLAWARRCLTEASAAPDDAARSSIQTVDPTDGRVA